MQEAPAGTAWELFTCPDAANHSNALFVGRLRNQCTVRSTRRLYQIAVFHLVLGYVDKDCCKRQRGEGNVGLRRGTRREQEIACGTPSLLACPFITRPLHFSWGNFQ